MGKTRHLCRPEHADALALIEVEIERRWQRLRALNEHPLL
jgi:pyruvate ferredoxin oxidoreductase alpha subunit